MEKRRVGKSNLEVTVIGLGAWGISGDFNKVNDVNMIDVLKEAYKVGINFFDTAPIYGFEGLGPKGFGKSEKLIGHALRKVRNKIIIATKFGIVLDESGKGKINTSEKSIKKEIDESLRRLQTDYIDLYQAHWPDLNTPIEETFLTLNELKKVGKIRFIGVCNYSIKMIEESMRYSNIISTQNLYNIIQRNSEKFYKENLLYRTEKEILPFCEKRNLGFFPFSPLCQGLLTGKNLKMDDYEFEIGDFRSGNPEFKGENLKKNLELVKSLLEIAISINKPLSQLTLNWLIKDKRITSVIAGPTKISEIKDNFLSTTWTLSDNIYQEINNLLRNY